MHYILWWVCNRRTICLKTLPKTTPFPQMSISHISDHLAMLKVPQLHNHHTICIYITHMWSFTNHKFSLWGLSCTSSSPGSHGTSSEWQLPTGGGGGGRPSPAHPWTNSGSAHKPNTHEQHCLMLVCGCNDKDGRVGSVKIQDISSCLLVFQFHWMNNCTCRTAYPTSLTM